MDAAAAPLLLLPHQSRLHLRTKPCTLKRLLAAVVLISGAVWLKTGTTPHLGSALSLLLSLLFVLEMGHCLLEYDAIDMIVVNALFSVLVNRLVLLL